MFRNLGFAVIGVTFALSLRAASFVVPEDHEMFRRSDAVVTGTISDNRVARAEGGWIETITTLEVSESIKGPDLRGRIEVHAPGGHLGDSVLVVPGSPRFERGRRVLLFLTRTPQRTWAVTDLLLGKFEYAFDSDGTEIVLRETGLKDHGFADGPGLPVEAERSASLFLEYLKALDRGGRPVVRYLVQSKASQSPAPLRQSTATDSLSEQLHATFPASSYTTALDTATQYGSRWNVFPNAVSLYTTGSLAGAPNNGVDAIVTAIARWNDDCASNITYRYAGVNQTATGGLRSSDNVNTLQWERDLTAWGVSPYVCGAGGTVGIGGVTRAAGTHPLNGETFYTTQEVDVEMNRGLAGCSSYLSSGNFITGVAHELGHTLGFRHADQNRFNNGPCPASSMECSTAAVMTSSIVNGLNGNLQGWDQNAARGVYPGGSCAAAVRRVRSDFNGDYRADIFWRNTSDGRNWEWLMDGARIYASIQAFSLTDQNWQPVGIGDFDGDGMADVFWRNRATGGNQIWFFNPYSYATAYTTSMFDSNWEVVAVGDFNADARADVFWRHRTNGANALWLMNGTSANGYAMPSEANVNWRIFGAADYDGDGMDDLFWRNVQTGGTLVWLLNGPSRTPVPGPTEQNLNWVPVAFGDVDVDLKGDVVWRNNETGGTMIWFMSSGTRRYVGFLSPIAPPWGIQAAGDYDGNGSMDLAWRNSVTGANMIWLMNGPNVISNTPVGGMTDPSWRMIMPR